MRPRLLLPLALAVAAAALVPVAVPAGAQEGTCTQRNSLGQCIVWAPVEVPGRPGGGSGTPSGGNGGGGGGSAPTGPPPVCVWRTVPPPVATSRPFYPGAPDGAIWQVLDCGSISEHAGRGYRWLPPGTPEGPQPGPPGPEIIAQMLLAAAEARMEAPTLASDPPVGVSAVVDVPAFVAVTNWQDEIVEGECVLGTCVSLTATPTLVFDPGDGSEPVTCPPGGSRYAPGGPPLDDQAEGACAHAYPRRTGIDDRPDAWPGEVSVRWDISWTSTVDGGPGPSGTFDPLVFSTGLPRSVEEVGTVVVEGES